MTEKSPTAMAVRPQLTKETTLPAPVNLSSSFGAICVAGYIAASRGTFEPFPLQAKNYVEAVSEAAKEASRQIERLRPYAKLAEGGGDKASMAQRSNILSAMNLICGFSTSNLPIPTASVADSVSTLFLNDQKIYGDMEISDGKVGYYLKWADDKGGVREIIDEEQIDGDRLPRRLLGYLYSRLAHY